MLLQAFSALDWWVCWPYLEKGYNWYCTNSWILRLPLGWAVVSRPHLSWRLVSRLSFSGRFPPADFVPFLKSLCTHHCQHSSGMVLVSCSTAYMYSCRMLKIIIVRLYLYSDLWLTQQVYENFFPHCDNKCIEFFSCSGASFWNCKLANTVISGSKSLCGYCGPTSTSFVQRRNLQKKEQEDEKRN